MTELCPGKGQLRYDQELSQRVAEPPRQAAKPQTAFSVQPRFDAARPG